MTDNKILAGDMDFIVNNFKRLDIFYNKTVLITGFAGFLGYYFSNFFAHLMDNYSGIKKLILLDNFLLGNPAWLNKIKKHKTKIKVINFDIAKDRIKDIGSAKNADFVIHMASIASPVYYRKYPLQTIDANVWGLRNLLDYYKKLSLSGFLFFSSSEIYGDPPADFIPTPEEYRGNVFCSSPRACYDEAKRFGETLCYVYAHAHGMPIRIVRPFNNYGPGMNLNDKRVPADFARAVIKGEDIIIYSSGSPTRTFCYVADAIVGYLKALAHDRFDYFNIGMDMPEISIKELANIYKKRARKIFAYDGRIVYKTHEDKNYLTNNPSRRCPDITKAKQVLDFKPKIGIVEGVGLFLGFLKEEGNTI